PNGTGTTGDQSDDSCRRCRVSLRRVSAAARTVRSEPARRARVLLTLAHGDSYSAIEAALRAITSIRAPAVPREAPRGLKSWHYNQPPSVLTMAMGPDFWRRHARAPRM